MIPFLSRSDGCVQFTLIRLGFLTSVSATAFTNCKGPGPDVKFKLCVHVNVCSKCNQIHVGSQYLSHTVMLSVWASVYIK